MRQAQSRQDNDSGLSFFACPRGVPRHYAGCELTEQNRAALYGIPLSGGTSEENTYVVVRRDTIRAHLQHQSQDRLCEHNSRERQDAKMIAHVKRIHCGLLLA